MKSSANRLLFFDKVVLALGGAVALAIVFSVMSFVYTAGIERENALLKKRMADIQSLAQDIVRIKNDVRSKERKIGRNKSSGIVSTLEQTLRDLGIEAQVIKPLDNLKLGDYSEENAELEIQGTDLNSIVNLLFKIDMSPAPMKIKSASIKTTFQDPDKFILKLTVSLISGK